MIRLRGGSGLGDAIYVRPIAEHLVARGERVTVLTDYPDVFLGAGVQLERFSRRNVTHLAHYTGGKQRPHTNQWQDVCGSAGVSTPLQCSWETQNHALVGELLARAAGRPLVLVHGGRVPMGRTDGFGRELLPRQDAFERVLAALSGCFRVRIGKGEELYPLPADLDLNGSTSVADLMDLGAACDAVVGQCSFAIPLAEIFDKPFLGVWSSEGLRSRETWVRLVTPQKILSKPTSRAVVDDEAPADLMEKALAFEALMLETTE